MTPHDRRMLIGVHPQLINSITKVLDEMEAAGTPMMVCYGVRTTAEQQALYAQGRSKPGHIVTNADGVTHLSNHQVKADGLGRAVDCCFVVGGVPSWDIHLPWHTYGEWVQKVGLSWGGTWHRLVDLPHAELI